MRMIWDFVHLNLILYLKMLEDFINDYIVYHALTISVLTIILGMIFIHHHGSEKSLSIAKNVKQQMDPILKKSFDDYSGQLIVESSNIIKLYVSGRQSCLFGIIAFALVPRQQILSFLFNSILIGLKDEIVIQIPILNEHPLSITMVIIRKSNIKMLTKKKYPDVKQLCKEYKPILKPNQNVPETHSILVEKVEHYKYFLHNEQEMQLWRQHGKSVRMVYMSDVNRFSRYPMTVRMVINAGKDVIPLLNWLITYVDRMSKARMTSGQRREAIKRREGLQFKTDF